jgi:hypothetical protein
MARDQEENLIHRQQSSTNYYTMKLKWFYTLSLAFATIGGLTACDKNDDNDVTYYDLQDQMARPAINTVFVADAEKDVFNTTIPSAMGAAFAAKFKNKLLALNAGYTTNALGQNADQLTGLLATDVLNVSTTDPTSFYDGTNLLTGRNLMDDVIDIELLLLFGGPNGMANPTLTKDNVGSNDKPFLAAFPYMAAPH